jgi:hypothetical protein
MILPSSPVHLVHEWIPALDGVEAKLRAGAYVAIVGGGCTLVTELEDAFPASRFDAFDDHQIPGAYYDLVACWEYLRGHEDPVGVARHIHGCLADDGTWLVVDACDFTDAMIAGGFWSARRVCDTPLHLVLEARP